MYFYTNVDTFKGKLLLSGYRNGIRVKRIVDYKPKLYSPDKNGEYKTMDGKPLGKIDFDSIWDARQFVENYKTVSNFEIYGSTSHEYVFLNEEFGGEVQYDPSAIRVATIDIETDSRNGFPDIKTANREIWSMVIGYGPKDKREYICFAAKEYSGSDTSFTYIKCQDERDLLVRFVGWWEKMDFDVVTGWHIEFFDIPFLMKRIENVLGLDSIKKMSRWKNIKNMKTSFKDDEFEYKYPLGLVMLDYIALYKKFNPAQQESYSLDYIGRIEVESAKISYDDIGSLAKLYLQDFNRHVEYNLQDVKIVDKIDEKLGYVQQAIAIAYTAKVLYTDALGAVRLWDTIIHNYLMEQKIIVPMEKDIRPAESITGAYVHEPKAGMYKWVANFDVTSLYPSLIMTFNIGPDTLVGKISNVTPHALLNEETANELIEEADKHGASLTAGGACYLRDMESVTAAVTQKMFNMRVENRNKAKEKKKEFSTTKNQEALSASIIHDNIQKAVKIILNSLYGAFSNRFFRFYSLENAEAITLTGQYIIQRVMKSLNDFINAKTKMNEQWVIYGDTDSVYICLEKLIAKLFPNETDEKIVNWIDSFCEKEIAKFLQKEFSDICSKFKTPRNALGMKRELIAKNGVWMAKKKYILNVYDTEGIRTKEPEIKVTGFMTNRSDAPRAARATVKDAIKIIMNKNQYELISFIETSKKDFFAKPWGEIAFPRGVNNMEVYESSASIYKQKTPIHVRASLLYNHMLKEKGLSNSFPKIGNGDKIKFAYLKLPNPLRENVIAASPNLPEEFGLSKYIDKETQYEKSVITPLKDVADAIGWEIEKINTLEGILE